MASGFRLQPLGGMQTANVRSTGVTFRARRMCPSRQPVGACHPAPLRHAGRACHCRPGPSARQTRGNIYGSRWSLMFRLQALLVLGRWLRISACTFIGETYVARGGVLCFASRRLRHCCVLRRCVDVQAASFFGDEFFLTVCEVAAALFPACRWLSGGEPFRSLPKATGVGWSSTIAERGLCLGCPTAIARTPWC